MHGAVHENFVHCSRVELTNEGEYEGGCDVCDEDNGEACNYSEGYRLLRIGRLFTRRCNYVETDEGVKTRRCTREHLKGHKRGFINSLLNVVVLSNVQLHLIIVLIAIVLPTFTTLTPLQPIGRNPP